MQQEDQDRNAEGDMAAADGTALKWKGGLWTSGSLWRRLLRDQEIDSEVLFGLGDYR